jgi:hypothetical protein
MVFLLSSCRTLYARRTPTPLMFMGPDLPQVKLVGTATEVDVTLNPKPKPDLPQVKLVGTATEVDVACLCSSTGFFAVEMQMPPPYNPPTIELTVSNSMRLVLTLSSCSRGISISCMKTYADSDLHQHIPAA